MAVAAVFIAKYFYLFSLAIGSVFFLFQKRQTQKSMVVCAVIVAPLAYIIAKLSSLFYYDARPFVIGHFMPLVAHIADNGFPSDHVLLAGAIAAVIYFYNKKLSVLLLVLAIVIGWARVYAGIHHPVDILGSLVIAIIAGGIYYFFIGSKSANV